MRQMVFDINSEYAKISEVIPGLFISGVCALTPSTIAANKIQLIVNTTEEVPNVKSLGKVNYVKLSLKDTPESDILSYLAEVCQKIDDALKASCNVLIHSVQGISRCAAFCLAYMLKTQGISLKDAYEMLKSKRAMVRINIGFWEQLTIFEQNLTKCQGKCCEGSTSSDIQLNVAEVPNRIKTCSAAGDRAAEKMSHSQLLQSLSAASSAQQKTDTLAAFAQVFYDEIKRRAKCRRKISPVFKPVLEPLYEQSEIAV